MPYAIRQGDIPGVQLRCERSVHLPAAVLWRWLTEPDYMRRWLADEVELDADGLRLSSLLEDGERLAERGETLAREEGRLWAMAFQRLDDGWETATELRLEVSADEPGRLTVLQRRFERLSLSRCLSVWELYRRRWRAALERLATEVERDSD